MGKKFSAKKPGLLGLIFISLSIVGCNFVNAENNENIYRIGAVSSLYKIFKFKQKIPVSDRIEVYSAKNEYECFQILIYDVKKDLNNVVVDVSDLESIDGENKISSSFIKVKEVGYVPTKKPYYRTSYVGLWPDPLLKKEKFNVKKGERKVLWVTIYIPDDTLPGQYKGSIGIISENGGVSRLPLRVKVWNFRLPQTFHLKTAFDFYPQFTPKFYPRKRGEGYQEWKERIAAVNEDYFMSMLEYRISPILNLDPLSNDFEQRIKKYLNQGINAFAIGRYGGSFGNNWPKDKYDYLVSLYRRYAEVLRKDNLLDKAYLYTWDEGKIGNPRVKEVTRLIHKADPELKNMVCYHGFWDAYKNPEWGKDIDIWCFQIANYNERLKNKLESLGKEIWMYVSGPGGDYPNLAIDFPAMDPRILPWMCWKYKFKGFLYWAVNFTRVNPFEDAMNTDWQQNGNGLLFYPGEDGPVPSLRLEIFRDGMEDYEYLYILSKKIKKAETKIKGADKKKILEEARELLDIHTIVRSLSNYTNKPKDLLQRRRRIGDMIEKLNKFIKENP